MVTEIWLGDPSDPAAGDRSDLRRASILIGITGLLSALIAIIIIWLIWY